MENKQFDCVELKRSIQAQIHSETKNFTQEQLIKYYASQPLSDSLAKWRSSVLTQPRNNNGQAA
jgi:hypothetical protein